MSQMKQSTIKHNSSFLSRHAPVIGITICSIFTIIAVAYPHYEQKSSRAIMHKNVLRDIEIEKQELQQQRLAKQQQQQQHVTKSDNR